MSYLLDTNIISEIARPKPNVNVLSWFNAIPNETLFLSVLTLGEIRKGVEMLPNSKRKEKLLLWLELELPAWFEDRILIIDQHVANMWGYLQSTAKRSLPAIDSLIAATALHYELRLVTRNEKDFQYPNLQVINPFNFR